MRCLQNNGKNTTDKENKMAAKSMTPAQAAAAVKKATAKKTAKTPTSGTGQSGYSGKVSPAVLAQVKKDGMALALQKVATYKAPSNPYIEAAYRMYGKAKVDAVRNSPAVQKKLSTAGTGGTNPGTFMSPNEIKKFVTKAAKANIALPKAVLDMIKKAAK
jgi:hypothetical protein